jgi:hypothetical protein
MSRYKPLGIAALACGMTCLLLADDPVRQKVQVTSTQRLDLASGGTVRLKNSAGQVSIEAWDQPGVEITTVKSTRNEYTAAEGAKATHDLDGVKIAAGRSNGEVVINTNYRRKRRLPFALLVGNATNIDLNYSIKVPRDAHLVVDHEIGDVYFDDVTGDIRATTHQGTITLRLPAGSQYELDAKTKIGSITSDFPGSTKRRGWLIGRNFLHEAKAPHKLYLRAGVGDIIILEARMPRTPAALRP